jgi:GNAT superfamily N-acetyltransferase
MVTVRRATVDDAAALGSVHVRAWQAAYRGQMPDDYLDGLRAEERAAMWRQSFDRRRTDRVLLVAEIEGGVVGFALAGSTDDPPGLGELYALNVDPDSWGAGAGQALLAAVREALVGLGHDEAVLWVLPGNARARRVYEANGWVADGAERVMDILGVTVSEVRYRTPLREVAPPGA